MSTATWSPSRVRELVRGVQPRPARQDHGRADRTVERDRAGKRRPGPDHVRTLDPGFGQHRLDELGRRVESGRRGVVDVELGQPLDEHRRREVGDRDPHETVVEVNPDHGTRGRIEAKQDRRAAPAGGPGLRLTRRLLDDEPASLQLRDERRNGRPGQPGVPGEVAPARGAVPTQRVDHP